VKAGSKGRNGWTSTALWHHTHTHLPPEKRKGTTAFSMFLSNCEEKEEEKKATEGKPSEGRERKSASLPLPLEEKRDSVREQLK